MTTSAIKPARPAAEAPFYRPVSDEMEVFRAAARRGLPVLLKGPTGCGKTRFVEAMAHELGRSLITVGGHEDLTSADLVGRFLLKGGETVWVDGPLTRAVRQGDRYVINGMKTLITSGRSAKVAVVLAVTDPDAGKRGISAFLVRTEWPGYKVLRVERKLGHRTNDTCQIALENLEVPAENMLGRPDEGLKIALSGLDSGRVAVAAQGIGVWIGVQAFINIGVNMGVLPTKGLTLPLLSFGGSGIVANCVAIAILLRIDYENRRMLRGFAV